VNSAASVGGSGSLRLFFGLPLPRDAREALVDWQAAAFAGRQGVRIVPPEHLHVTLAFLGSRPADELAALGRALRDAAAGVERPVLTVARYRETERVGMLVMDDEEGRAGLLQARLSQRLERLGAYRPERRPWLAHLTVARFQGRPRLLPALPELGPVSPSEAALYHSVLRPSGAQYDIVESVALGG
jgi:RNA 2',3'-cyclic 3'-phosphodiesterase